MPGARPETALVKFLSWIGLVVAAALLVACARPSEQAKAPSRPLGPTVERAGPVAWNAATGGFELSGRPLKTVKLWTFDGSTDGFTGGRSAVTPAQDQGLAVTVVDPSLRSPAGLDVPGGQYSQVIVRLTRIADGGGWDGALYYSTAAHPESAAFLAKPAGAPPGVGETATLVYDMSRPAAGGGDWLASRIDQLRFDLDDKAGARFLIHQVAVAENPNAAPPPKHEPEPVARAEPAAHP
jgi:hypothetical protein